MFKLSPTSVVQGRAPATTSYVHHCQTGKNLQRCFVDMGMDLVGPAFPPPPSLHLFFGPIRGPHTAKKNPSRAPLLSWKVDEWGTH